MEATVRHVITVKDPSRVMSVTFEFESHDIGCTQGSTLWHGNMQLVQYRPGTGHWNTALEIAVEVAKATVELATHEGRGKLREAAVLAVERHRYARPWNGDDENWHDDRPVDWNELERVLGIEIPEDRRNVAPEIGG